MAEQTFADPTDLPLRQVFLPFSQPDIEQAEIDEVVDTLARVGSRQAPKPKSSSGALPSTLARAMLCGQFVHRRVACGIGCGWHRPGRSSDLPTMTFCATANVVVHWAARRSWLISRTITILILLRSRDASHPVLRRSSRCTLLGNPAGWKRSCAALNTTTCW